MPKKHLHVAVGILRNSRGEVLLGQRLPGKHLAGYWEFPGGKVEFGETVQQALERELHEELGVQVQSIRPLITVKHYYPERSVLLDTWVVDSFTGTVQDTGPEGQALRWVPETELANWQLPPADRPIVNAIRLPERYLITPSGIPAEELLQGVSDAVSGGVRLVQLRGVEVDQAGNTRLIDQLLQLCGAVPLVCNAGTAAQLHAAERFGFAGVHLKSSLLMQLRERPVSESQWLGCSVHSAEELQQAVAINADFAVLSPVAETLSHPGQPELGWDAAAKMAAAANLPVYALGGMQPEHIAEAQRHGLQGIAAIRGLWPPAR